MTGSRVLILCADIGAGHVTVARTLADALRAREDVDAVELRTDLDVMGRRVGAFLNDGFDTHLDRIGWTYELAYRVFFELGPPRRGAHMALAALGGRGLRRTIADFDADVVVTEYPVLSAALGQLRAQWRLDVPVCSSVSDPAGLYYWAHPGIDLHLLSWPEALDEVERIAGPGRASPVRPLIDPRFFDPPARHEARASLGLPPDARVVLVSGGGWGLGDLDGIVGAALERAEVVCLTGRNEELRARLERTHPRARALGFTDQMPALLAAVDALVHTTGGTTALEARVVGCPLINYGTGVAHVRAHARAMAEQGLADWAPNFAALTPALERTLALPRPGPLETNQLPDAASLVVKVAERFSANHRAASTSAAPAGPAS